MQKSSPEVTNSQAAAYATGVMPWPEIRNLTGASFGELLVEVGLIGPQIPRVKAARSQEQSACLKRILDSVACGK